MRYIVYAVTIIIVSLNFHTAQASPRGESCISQRLNFTKSTSIESKNKTVIEKVFGVKLRGPLRGLRTFSHKRCKRN